jgi:hypothetical protein
MDYTLFTPLSMMFLVVLPYTGRNGHYGLDIMGQIWTYGMVIGVGWAEVCPGGRVRGCGLVTPTALVGPLTWCYVGAGLGRLGGLVYPMDVMCATPIPPLTHR